MTNGLSRLYGEGEVAAREDVAAAAVSRLAELPATLSDAHGEIDTLRSINAHLVKQVRDLKKSVAHAQSLADRDGLTGLYNRRKMAELLDASLAEARSQDRKAGLLFIDLDGFKSVNDAHGHTAGDELLMTVAARISARVRAGDYVCRYGGDEFVVILPNLTQTSALRFVADSIARRVALPYRVGTVDLCVTAAIGAAVFPDEAQSPEALLQCADQWMYRMKADGDDRTELPGPAPARRREDRVKRRHYLDAL